jgi:hypothetical protein
MSEVTGCSLGDLPVWARVAGRAKKTLSCAVAVASLAGLVACGDDSNGTTPGNDAGGQAQDSGKDSTVTQPDTGTGTDTGSPNQMDALAETSPPPTGDAGEPCTPPGKCAPGLFCNSLNVCQPSYCDGKPQRGLPYAIENDFQTVFTIGPEKDNLNVVASGAECDSMTYPPIPNTGLVVPGDAGADGAADAGAGDASDDGGAAADAATDAHTTFPTLNDGGVSVVTYPTTPSCYEFLYDPSCLTGTQGLCWAGAEFTNSAATAAAAPDGHVSSSAVGVCLASGATVVSFSARSSVDGSLVKFGSSRPGACGVTPINPDGGAPDPAGEQTTCPGDTEFVIKLSTSWQQYSVTLPATEPYNDEPGAGGGVWNAFSLVVEPENFEGGAYLFVKDVVWSNPTLGFDAGLIGDGGEDASSDAEVGDAATSDAASSEAGAGEAGGGDAASE